MVFRYEFVDEERSFINELCVCVAYEWRDMFDVVADEYEFEVSDEFFFVFVEFVCDVVLLVGDVCFKVRYFAQYVVGDGIVVRLVVCVDELLKNVAEEYVHLFKVEGMLIVEIKYFFVSERERIFGSHV